METQELVERLRLELGPGEHMLWSGRPRQGLFLRRDDWFWIPSSLVWNGVMVYVGSHAPNVIFATPTILVGLYLLIGRFFADAALRRRTLYALTNERVWLIRDEWFRVTVKSLHLRSVDLELDERPDGSGTLMLAVHGVGWVVENALPIRGRYIPRPLFELSDSAAEVFRQISKARRAQLDRS